MTNHFSMYKNARHENNKLNVTLVVILTYLTNCHHLNSTSRRRDVGLNSGSKVGTSKLLFLCLPALDDWNGKQVLVDVCVLVQDVVNLHAANNDEAVIAQSSVSDFQRKIQHSSDITAAWVRA